MNHISEKTCALHWTKQKFKYRTWLRLAVRPWPSFLTSLRLLQFLVCKRGGSHLSQVWGTERSHISHLSANGRLRKQSHDTFLVGGLTRRVMEAGVRRWKKKIRDNMGKLFPTEKTSGKIEMFFVF